MRDDHVVVWNLLNRPIPAPYSADDLSEVRPSTWKLGVVGLNPACSQPSKPINPR